MGTLIRYCVGVLLFAVCCNSHALYVWVDSEGVKHISTVPRSCITREKTVRIECMPTSPSQEARLQREAERARRTAEAEYQKLLDEKERVEADRTAVFRRLKTATITYEDLTEARVVGDELFAIEEKLDKFYDEPDQETRREARAIENLDMEEELALAENRLKEQQRDAEMQDINQTLEGLKRYFGGYLYSSRYR